MSNRSKKSNMGTLAAKANATSVVNPKPYGEGLVKSVDLGVKAAKQVTNMEDGKDDKGKAEMQVPEVGGDVNVQSGQVAKSQKLIEDVAEAHNSIKAIDEHGGMQSDHTPGRQKWGDTPDPSGRSFENVIWCPPSARWDEQGMQRHLRKIRKQLEKHIAIHDEVIVVVLEDEYPSDWRKSAPNNKPWVVIVATTGQEHAGQAQERLQREQEEAEGYLVIDTVWDRCSHETTTVVGALLQQAIHNVTQEPEQEQEQEQTTLKLKFGKKDAPSCAVVFVGVLQAQCTLHYEQDAGVWTHQHVVGVLGIDQETTASDVRDAVGLDSNWVFLGSDGSNAWELAESHTVWEAVRSNRYCALFVWDKTTNDNMLPSCWTVNHPLAEQDIVQRETRREHIYLDKVGCDDTVQRIFDSMRRERVGPKTAEAAQQSAVQWRKFAKGPAVNTLKRTGLLEVPVTPIGRGTWGGTDRGTVDGKHISTSNNKTSMRRPNVKSVTAQVEEEVDDNYSLAKGELLFQGQGNIWQKLVACLTDKALTHDIKSLKAHLKGKLRFDVTPGDSMTGDAIVPENSEKIQRYVLPLRQSPSFARLPSEVLMHIVVESLEGSGSGVDTLRTIVNRWWKDENRVAWGTFTLECERQLFAAGSDPSKRVLEEFLQDSMPNLRFWQVIETAYSSYLGAQGLDQLDRATEGNLLEKVLGNMSGVTYRNLRTSGVAARLVCGVRKGDMSFAAAWAQVLDELKGFEALDRVEAAQRERRTKNARARGTYNVQEAVGIDEDTVEDQNNGTFQMLEVLDEEEEDGVADARALPEAMKCVYVVGVAKTPEEVTKGKICFSCGKPDHYSYKCPAYNKTLPFAPAEVREKLLARNKQTGELRMARRYGDQGTSEAARNKSANKVSVVGSRGGAKDTSMGFF